MSEQNVEIEESRGENAIENREVAGLSQGQIVFRRFVRHKAAMTSVIVMVAVALLAITSIGWGPIPGWWQWNYTQTAPQANPGGTPTLQLWGESGFRIGDYPFGQDELGRDNFARVMRGIQTSLVVMFIVAGVSSAIGILIGAVSGFFRGWLDSLLMRFTELFIVVPVLITGAVLGKLFGSPAPIVLAIALGVLNWTSLARLVRAEFLSLREREFVEAARVAGASNSRIIFKHMLPNTIAVIIVNTTLMLSSAVLLETALSYLGFGIQRPEVSLGNLISEYQSAFTTRPWLFWWPGLFIVLLALCVNFIGDGLRDAFDPRQRKIPTVRAMRKAERKAQALELTSTTLPAKNSKDV
ncbi:ABC transporter permease [Populibacterium corticicola]|uniref:ABC transporter permease n=1 Tax=Populibacterium corticicola TaxID=1812826 RepID=A0ABW5XGZ2_9MICO